MKRLTLLLAAVLMAGCATKAPRETAAGETAVAVDVDYATPVQAMAGYEFGQPREPLTLVEDIVRDALHDPAHTRAAEAALLELLDHPSATHAAKLFACRQLAFVGGSDTVDALAPWLESEATSDAARLALERIPGEDVDKVLLKALKEADDSSQIGIINSLGVRRAAGAEKILDELSRSINPAIAGAAADALAKIRG